VKPERPDAFCPAIIAQSGRRIPKRLNAKQANMLNLLERAACQDWRGTCIPLQVVERSFGRIEPALELTGCGTRG
jgi:hypothetical protein